MKLTKLQAKNFYTTMILIRLVEEAIATEYAKQEMRCPTHLAIGQEAIAAGIAPYLTRHDIAFSTHRSHAHYLAKGGSMKAMIAELYGRETGCARGFGGSQHLIDLSVNFWGSTPIVASTIPVAVGTALSLQMKKQKGKIVVVYFGDAATEEGVVAESLNYAALRKLPIFFVCENNFYSTNTPIADRQPMRPIYKLAAAFGLAAYQEDGNDVTKVSALASSVVRSIRSGNGPAFIEFITYRTREHCGPGFDPPGYRPEKEKVLWAKKDPLTLFRRLALEEHYLNEFEMDSISGKISKQIIEAFAFAKASPYTKDVLSEELLFAR